MRKKIREKITQAYKNRDDESSFAFTEMVESMGMWKKLDSGQFDEVFHFTTWWNQHDWECVKCDKLHLCTYA